MAIYIKSARELEEELKAYENKAAVIVHFCAEWCIPCKEIEPLLQELDQIYPDIVRLSVDVDYCMELIEKYRVCAMPSFLVVVNGDLVNTVIGADVDRLELIYRRYSAFS